MFDNTIKLVKFILSREKVISTVWVVSIVIINMLLILLLGNLMMSTAAERRELMFMFEVPALLAMVGPMYDVNLYGMGQMYILFMLVFTGVTVGIMNVFLVVRHLRADEEAGRYEVLRSLPNGRLSIINATMISALIINTVMALLIALTMWPMMIAVDEPMGFMSALVTGLGLGAVGMVFAAIAAVFCQLCQNARSASSFSFFALGLFYMLRAGGDMNPADMGILAYISPLGLLSRSWPYIHDRLWPVLVNVGIAVVVSVLAYWLANMRDIDQGLIPARPGKPEGGVLMRSAFGLNFRLLRLSVIVWVLMLFVIGISYSTVLEGMDEFIAGNEAYRTMVLGPTGLMEVIDAQVEAATVGMTGAEAYALRTELTVEAMNQVLGAAGLSVTLMFANMIGNMMAMMALIPLIIFILRARREELDTRAELIVATATRKTGYLMSFVIIAFATAILAQLGQAFGMYAGARAIMANPGELPIGFLIESYIVYVPALWVMTGIAVLLAGLFPKRVGWVWAYYGYTFFVMLYGRMPGFPAWLGYTTPLGFIPQLPLDETNWAVLAILSLVGIALAALGMYFYRKRDINAVVA